jgi:hypothetical protein
MLWPNPISIHISKNCLGTNVLCPCPRKKKRSRYTNSVLTLTWSHHPPYLPLCFFVIISRQDPTLKNGAFSVQFVIVFHNPTSRCFLAQSTRKNIHDKFNWWHTHYTPGIIRDPSLRLLLIFSCAKYSGADLDCLSSLTLPFAHILLFSQLGERRQKEWALW